MFSIMNMTKPAAIIAAFLLTGLLTGQTANAVGIQDFFGNYGNATIEKGLDSGWFAAQTGDLAITLEASGNGFSLRSQLPRSGKRLEETFEPERKNPGIFRSKNGADPMHGEPLAWAKLNGDTLSIYRFVVNQHGDFVMLSRHWTRSAKGRLQANITLLDEDGLARRLSAALEAIR